jgi:hypothetical protein
MTSNYEPVPSRIVLESPLPALAYDLAAHLEQRGLAPVEVRPAGPGPLALHHGPGTSAGLVSKLLDALQPLVPDGGGPVSRRGGAGRGQRGPASRTSCTSHRRLSRPSGS